MSALVIRLGDACFGHGCWPPRPNDQGSPNVYVNGIPVHRVGDHWPTHCCDDIAPCHDGHAATGSGVAFANGQAVCRVGDMVDCGSTMGLEHSSNVYAG